MIPMAPGFFKPRVNPPSTADNPYLVSLFVGGSTAAVNWDKTDISNPNKVAYDASPDDLYYYLDSAFGTFLSYTQSVTVTQGYFYIDKVYSLFAGNTSNALDNAALDIEFLNGSGACRAALRIRKSDSFRLQLSYGVNLSSLSNATQGGGAAATYVQGDITFTSSSLTFTRTRADYYNDSFTLGSLTLGDVTTLRYTNGALYAASIAVNSVAAVAFRVRDS